jgi:tetratricopeptide (TPR) repeat protein
VIPPPSREPLQVPVNPLPDLPARPESGQEEKIVFSRTVRAAVGQLVEIPFRGTGWVYLGELGLPRGIAYDSRRLDPEGQTFIFKVEAAGTYALKFYKQDFIRDYILNDYVQVIAVETGSPGAGWFTPPADQGRVTAEPRWPPLENPPQPSEAPLPEAAALPVTPAGPVPAVPAAAPEEAPVSPASDPAPAPARATAGGGPEPGDYVRRAQEEYNAGRVAEALSILDHLQSDYPSLTDEALWLYGQFLESNSPGRDIRLALEYYRRLIREYPQSPLVPQARRRIAYLERYYFNIQ